jgi:hypothetical protein
MRDDDKPRELPLSTLFEVVTEHVSLFGQIRETNNVLFARLLREVCPEIEDRQPTLEDVQDPLWSRALDLLNLNQINMGSLADATELLLEATKRISCMSRGTENF